MTIFREITVESPSIKIIENGEDKDRTLTAVVQTNQVRGSDREEQVVWTITFPKLTPHQFRCLGEQFELTAGLAEDDRARLKADQNFVVELKRVATG